MSMACKLRSKFFESCHYFTYVSLSPNYTKFQMLRYTVYNISMFLEMTSGFFTLRLNGDTNNKT